MAAGQQAIRMRAVQVEPLGLAVRADVTAGIGPLVPVESQPPQVFEDALLRLARRPLAVGVFDAQDEGAPAMAREQPVEQRRAGVADVQLSRGAWSKAQAHCPHPLRSNATA